MGVGPSRLCESTALFIKTRKQLDFLLLLNPAPVFPPSLQYLIKVNEIKTKKGVDLLQNLIKYYHAQCK